MWCQKRITYPALAVKFGDDKHRFYLESVCAGAITNGEKLCNECLNKAIQTKTQDNHTFPHGLVSGPYPKESHIYDSEWYKAKVATYGPPTSEDLDLAMQAQTLARAGKGIRKPEDAAVAQKPVVVVEPVAAPEKPKGVRSGEKKEAAKPRKPRMKKEVVAPPPVAAVAVEEKNALVPIQKVPLNAPVETMDEPIPVSDVIQIILRPFSHNNVRYWRDGERDKVYKRMTDGKRGPYVGRWCSQTQSIVSDAPDSDQD